MGQRRQSIHKPWRQQRRHAGARVPSSSQGHLQRVEGALCVQPGPSQAGASAAAPGSSALIRGPANGSEDWPVPGTLLNRHLDEIYS